MVCALTVRTLKPVKAIAPFVESVGTDGLFETVEDVTPNAEHDRMKYESEQRE